MTTKMKIGRKPCKLDAICAKLQQISSNEGKVVASNGIAETAFENAVETVTESPTDLKCHNNNIIGKADMNSIEESLKEFRNAKLDQENAFRDMKRKNFEIDAKDAEIRQDIKIGKREIAKQRICAKYENQKTAKVGSSRRKSRKSSLPRSISQVRDHYNHVENYNGELTEYEPNNQNTKPPDNREVKYANKSLSPIDNSSEYDSDVGVPLDLSVNRTKDNESVINGDLTSECDSDVDDEIEDDEDFHPDRNLVIDEDISMAKSDVSSNTSGKYSGSEHVAHLKDFAESTMNELISMYGFSSTGQQVDLSKHIPTRNFRNNLLQFKYGSPSPNPTRAFDSAQYRNRSMSSDEDDDNDNDNGGDESCDGSTSLMNFYSPSGKVPGTGKLQNDHFTSSSSFVNAIYNTGAGQGLHNGPFMPGLPNYSKYLKRYNNGSECGSGTCKDLGYKEHYHCIDCSFQVFIKKEEMVRHYKWHRKREESLQHGFLRFSPLDNCSKRFGPCTHNGKQTHYHCLQGGCDKVYISTSDVQMHANYHRKDSAIMSEGFQRFRATEDCGTPSCAFYGQRTTHFHCLRSDCKFTFKNKADMEKHKSYHQKDEVLSRDGFKKFMKYEHCMYHGCRYSKVSNHIHCIRSGCDYVLHSTAQLYSHKRKHERRDFENAYKKYKDISHPTCTSNKLILPKADFRNLAGTPTSNSSPFIQTIAGLKRLADWDQTEPLELKKLKVEPHSDIDVSLQSTSSTRSTPALSSTPEEIAKTEEPMDDSSQSSVDSGDSCLSEKQHLKMDEDIEESLNLNESLKLPIPKFLIKKQSPPVLSPVQVTKFSATSTPTSMVSSSCACISSSMPGTLGASLVSMNPSTLLTVPSIVPSALTALQPPKTVYTERREKDDSWKTYLVRYTANDPCNPHCQYLYKDHYHCKIDGCLVLFKSKDGVREHARFHELQDRITPIAYQTYETVESCPECCQYSEKEKHYHCIWTGCTHVVPHVGPTFGRLEHYRIHEYTRAAAGKSYNRSGIKSGNMYEDSSMRRRGRPPKYPKIELPRIPKVELSDEEIRQSQLLVRDFEIASQRKVINGFRVFSPDDPCPDDLCSYNGKLHYHCARPRCFTITDRFDVLNLHAKDFHSFVKILEGYEFFDRNVSCRRLHCPNNQANRHFHCMRPKCDYSFIRHSTMTQHEKKHQCTGSSSPSLSPPTTVVPISPKPLNQDNILKVAAADVTSSVGSPASAITSSAAFISLCSLKQAQTGPIFFPHPVTQQITSLSQGTVILPPTVGLQAGNPLPVLPQGISPITLPVSTVQASVVTCTTHAGLPTSVVVSSPVTFNAINSSNVAGPSIPLAILLQRGMNQIPQPSWNDLKLRMHYAIAQNCGRPFCKLKKKDHYHCLDCNQAFSDPMRLRSHIGKHGVKFKQTDSINLFLTQSTNQASPQIEVKSSKTLKKEEYDLDLDEVERLSESTRPDSYESDKEDVKSSSLNLYPSTFSEMISKAQEQNKMSSDDDSFISNREIENNEDDENDECNLKIDTGNVMEDSLSDSTEQAVDISSRSGRKIIKTKHEGFTNSGNINLTKQRLNSTPKANNVKTLKSLSLPQKGPTAGTRGMRDDSIPDGYSRWRYNEECKYQKCAYRHSVTHFHCIRDDCGYGFSDRSRLLQHTLRHGRIDSITGGELQQYRINQDCENVNCEYNNKMSHYHCKRCSYSCTDSSKVLTHRKHHAKMDNITSQGFQKYLAADDCGISLCPYARKQNHFHCLIESCKASVLGPTQMASHKLKHANEIEIFV